MSDGTYLINNSYVSDQINKIRFIDEESNFVEQTQFVTGSNERIQLWKLVKNQFSEEGDNDFNFKSVSCLESGGDLTGLEIIDHNNFVASTGSGVSCIYMNRDLERNNLKVNHRFKNLHKFSTGSAALCTGLSVIEDTIATVGEDGKINVLSFNNQKSLLEIDDADSVTQTAVKFISYKELITGNRMGTMYLFDLRSGNREPAQTLMISCEDEKKPNGVTAITNHPTQQHIVLAGSEEGSITVYDLRSPNFPASYLCAHRFAITEMMFHPTQPDKFFTVSADGELWKWTQNHHRQVRDNMTTNTNEAGNPWLNGERAKKYVTISTVLSGLRRSITSLDCTRQNRLICSSHNEAIYMIDNILSNF